MIVEILNDTIKNNINRNIQLTSMEKIYNIDETNDLKNENDTTILNQDDFNFGKE